MKVTITRTPSPTRRRALNALIARIAQAQADKPKAA